MGPPADPVEISKQLPQDLTYSVHASADVRFKEVLEVAATAVTLKDLRAVRPAGNGRFYITVHTMRAAEKLREMGMLTLGDKQVPLISMASTVKVVTLLNLPAELPDEDVTQALSSFGNVMRAHRERYREYPTVETGARKILIEVRKEIPNFLIIRGF